MTQDEIFDILAMGHNVFLTGAAGSGKTFLIHRFIKHAHEHNISLAITASTGIAATHIGGITLHSWSGIGIRESLSSEDIVFIMEREYLMKRFLKTSILIIDEISMLSGEFLASLDILLQRARVSPLPFWGMQIVFVGDFFQLPPVSRGSSVEFAFEYPQWSEWRLVSAVLTTQYRQVGSSDMQDSLLEILNEIRSWQVSQRSLKLLASRHVSVDTEDHTELFTRNMSVDAYNIERLNSIHDDTYIFEMVSKWAEKLVESLKKWCLAPETLVLKRWARVMFVKNNFEVGYANGSIGHVVGKSEWLPVIELLDGTRIVADYMDWSIEENGKIKASITQIPLRLAWAITVHKSQGMTLESAVMDLSDAFVPGQGYVALSRVKSLAWLTLRGINDTALMIDPRVIAYDQYLQVHSLRAQERLSALTREEISNKIFEAIDRLGGTREKVTIHPKMAWWAKTPTHIETAFYLKKKTLLEDIADIRNLKPSTIVSHIEKLLEEWHDIDIEYLRPSDTLRLEKILEAFDLLLTENISPVREYMQEHYNDSYDFDEIRMARLFRA